LTSQSQTLTATITIQGPGNTLTIPVYWYNPGGSAPPSTVLDIAFSAPAGSNIALVVTEDIPESTGVEVATNSGGNWMNAALKSEYLYQVEITADPYGLAAGTYTGTVVVQPQEVSSNPITFPVTLFVWSGPAPMPTASPTSLSVSYQAGQNITSSLVTVSTGALSLPITSATEEDDGLLLQLQNRQSNTDLVTPDSFAVFASADYPGIYHGQITFTAPAASGNSVIVPLTLTVSPAIPYTGLTPLISSLANAASLLPGSIAPGEMVSIFCLTPPDTSSGLHVGQDGKVNTSSYGNRVLFNGIPAPLIYTSATQINAIVPYEIAGSTTATVELDMSGIHSLPWSVPVAQSAPGLFTQNGSGQGAAAILNQDNSLNTPSNPAARGSIVQMFLTGEGQTNPPGITGEVTQTDTKTSLLAVRVQIGGVDAKVLSATSAPDAVAGLFQINAQIPATASSGTRAVAVWIGSSLSQGTATISVQ
jgi:uncharacterized protein (TIGR03437 family)